MRTLLAVLVIGILIGGLGGEVRAKEQPQEQEKEVVFPPPPDKPRIKHLYSFARIQDVTRENPTFFKRVINFITGKKEITAKVLMRPYGLCVSQERIYVADTHAGVLVVWDEAGKDVRILDSHLHGKFSCPIGVAVDDSGTVYVTDSAQNVVKVFGVNEKFLYQIGVEGLNRPTGIVYDAGRRRILVADTRNSRILAYDTTGKLLSIIGKKGKAKDELSLPVNLAVDAKSRIYVVDPIRCCVQIFSPEGKFLSVFGEPGNTAGHFMRPRGIAVDSNGNIYVADAMFNVVQMFNQKGQLLMFFGGTGSAPGEMVMPAGLFIDEQDRVYVTDSLNRRVQVFQYIHYDEEESN